MKEPKPNLKFRNFVDSCFVLTPMIFSFFWLFQALQTLFQTGNLFGATPLYLFGNVHTLTVISVCVFYLFLDFIFGTHQEMPAPIRVVTLVLFVSIGLQFNGYVWSVCNFYLGSHTGTAALSLGYLAVVLSFLYAINRRYKVVEFHYRFMIVALIIFGISLILLLHSNFFQDWYLTENFGYPDPHNLQWGIEQFVAEWMWIGLVKKSS